MEFRRRNALSVLLTLVAVSSLIAVPTASARVQPTNIPPEEVRRHCVTALRPKDLRVSSEGGQLLANSAIAFETDAVSFSGPLRIGDATYEVRCNPMEYDFAFGDGPTRPSNTPRIEYTYRRTGTFLAQVAVMIDARYRLEGGEKWDTVPRPIGATSDAHAVHLVGDARLVDICSDLVRTPDQFVSLAPSPLGGTDATFTSNAAPVSGTATLDGARIEVRCSPDQYIWNFGASDSPPTLSGTVTHHYGRPGQYITGHRVGYDSIWRKTGTSAWTADNGLAQVGSGPRRVTIP